MNLTFPKISDLSFEQRAAVNLNYEKNHLVLGAPGTGKTIVAMHRINHLYEEGVRNLLLLVYNRPLMEYLRVVQKELNWEDRFEIYTVHEWLNTKMYSGYDGQKEKEPNEPLPKGIMDKTTPHEVGSTFDIKWYEINDDYKDKGKIYSHIVVDEGQDELLGFYNFIVKIADKVTIFADPNQALDENPVKVRDILNVIKKDSYFVLTLNYRNSKKVADFTRRYCVDKSVFAESYRDGEDYEVVKVKTDKEEILKNILEIVKKYDSDKEIGIIVPSSRDIEEMEDMGFIKGLNNDIYDYLIKNLPNNYDVTIYQNEKTSTAIRKNVDFEKKSIKIFSNYTVKGLDFDVVILFDVLSAFVNNSLDQEKNVTAMNKLYVSSTRPKIKLYTIQLGDAESTYLNDDVEIDYSKFPTINGMSGGDCYKKSLECYKEKKYDEAMYYLHYAISIVGLDDNQDILKDAMRKMAFFCERFNRNDFAVGLISNYADRTKIYDDPKLIYFYQSCLLNSYNGKLSYDDPERFCKIITKIDNKSNINVLLEKYFNKYLQNCKNAGMIPDAAFIAPFIRKYGLYDCKAWENFKEKTRYIKRDEEIKQKELERREREDSELWQDISKMSGNELLKGNKILVYAGARESDFHAGFETTIEKYGYNKKDFDLILQYNKMVHKEVSLKNVAAVILGPHPHNTIKNAWIFYVEVGVSEYPKGFKTSYDSGLTAEEFRDKLEEVTFYLRTVIYDERKAFEQDNC